MSLEKPADSHPPEKNPSAMADQVSGPAHDHNNDNRAPTGGAHSHVHALHDHSGQDHSGHGHADHVHGSYGKLLACFWIVAIFMLVEIVCGKLFHSLALLSDGFHMLSDAVSLGLSAFAVYFGSRRATQSKTFGYKRLEILAAFGNGLTLVFLSCFIAVEAVSRLGHPEPVAARSMMGVALAGMILNAGVAWWLHRGGEEKTLNEESVFIHVLGDLGASAAAVLAGLLIMTRGWLWADPALSLIIALVLAFGGVRVMRRSGHILIEGAPEGLPLESVRERMLSMAQVRKVHDLHVWTMNGRDLYLSAHIETESGEYSEKAVTRNLTMALHHDFQIGHITLQVGQCEDSDCLNNCEAPNQKFPSVI